MKRLKPALKELKQSLSLSWNSLVKTINSFKDDIIGWCLVKVISWLGTAKWDEVLVTVHKIDCTLEHHSPEPVWVAGYQSYYGACAYCRKKITPHHFESNVEGIPKGNYWNGLRYSECHCTKSPHPRFRLVAGGSEVLDEVIKGVIGSIYG